MVGTKDPRKMSRNERRQRDVEIEQLRNEFDLIRKYPDQMKILIKEFCLAILKDPHYDRPIKLTPLQYDIIVNTLTQRNLVLLAPRGSGKSFALAIAICIWMFHKRRGELVYVVAPYDDQAKTIFEYVIDFFETSETLRVLVRNLSRQRDPRLELKDGSRFARKAISVQSEGASFRSKHPTFLVVDESPFIPRDAFEPNVEPTVMHHKAPFINVGTPRHRDNHCYDYLYNPDYSIERIGSERGFYRLKYTWEDAIEQGDAYKPPYTKEEIELKKLQWGEDSIKFRMEYLCEFDEGVGQLFTESLFERTFVDRESFLRVAEDDRYYVCTIDFAIRMNSLVYVIWDVYADGRISKAEMVFGKEIRPQGADIDMVAARDEITDMVKKFNCNYIVLDATGQGIRESIEFKKMMMSKNFMCQVIEYKFSIKKGDSYLSYQSYMLAGRIKIPNPKIMLKDSESVKRMMRQHKALVYTMTKDDRTIKIQKSSKEHDDWPDAMMMIHAILEKAGLFGPLTPGNRNRDGNDEKALITERINNNKKEDFRRNSPGKRQADAIRNRFKRRKIERSVV